MKRPLEVGSASSEGSQLVLKCESLSMYVEGQEVTRDLFMYYVYPDPIAGTERQHL
jgi:hypothetical protein